MDRSAPAAPPVPIRSMRFEDADPVARLSGQLGYPASAADVARRFADIGRQPDAAVFVADDERTGGVVGWVHVYRVPLLETDDHAEIGGLVVAEGLRGRGIGRALMRAAEAWAGDRGCAAMRVRSQVF